MSTNQKRLQGREAMAEPFKDIIFVRYFDHVYYNRISPLALKPQIREAVGWLVYESEEYVTLKWDRDAEPPTLKGGDLKASGLVLLKSDILECKRLEHCFEPCTKPLQENSSCHLNSQASLSRSEYAFRPTERKTHGAKDSKRKEKL